MEQTTVTKVTENHVSSSGNDFAQLKLMQIIYFLFGVLEIFLALRFILLLLGARRVDFVDFIYRMTQIFVAPFLGIFPSSNIETGYFDTATIVAMIIYAVLSYIIVSTITLFTKRVEV